MAILNLRSVPDPLMRELRAAAAMAGQPFHAFCVGLLDEGLLIRRAPRVTPPPRVTVHPPIETMATETRGALVELANAATVAFAGEIDLAKDRSIRMAAFDRGDPLGANAARVTVYPALEIEIDPDAHEPGDSTQPHAQDAEVSVDELQKIFAAAEPDSEIEIT